MQVILLGASGFIGRQTLEVIDKLGISLLGASVGEHVEVIEDLVNHFHVSYITIKNENDYLYFSKKYLNIKFFYKDEGLLELVRIPEAQLVVNALVGFVGFLPSVEAIKNDKILALANKESLVVGGEIILQLLKEHPKAKLFPIDSEHVAIKKCLYGEDISRVESITLTASGGPFFNLDKVKFKDIKLEDALKHPTWKMGKKITIDSSTMINKAFEIIEAHYLFNLPKEKIKVKVDRTSYVHSFVTFLNGKVKLNIGDKDMRIPIEYALTLGKPTSKEGFKDVIIDDINNYHLLDMDHDKFPLIDLGYFIIDKKGDSGAVLNAVNDVVTAEFLSGNIKYIDIAKIIGKIMSCYQFRDKVTIEDIVDVNRKVRLASEYIIKKDYTK